MASYDYHSGVSLDDSEKEALRAVAENLRGRAARMWKHGDSCKMLGGDYESAYKLAWAFGFVAWMCDKAIGKGIPTRWRGGDCA